MGKIAADTKRNVVLLNTDDIIKGEELKVKINKIDKKVQRMLLLNVMSVTGSYLVFILVIARIYSGLNGRHVVLLVFSLSLVYILIGALAFFILKSISRKKAPVFMTTKSYLLYQVAKLFQQRKLIACYLLEYALILVVAGMFFFSDVKNGLTELFKLTAPVSLITYILGFYFL